MRLEFLRNRRVEAVALAGLIAIGGAACPRTTGTDSEPSPTPIVRSSDVTPTPEVAETFLNEEERNTKIAKDFMTAIFANDMDKIASLLHPDVRNRFNSLAPAEKDSFREDIKIFSSCDPNTLKRTKYEIKKIPDRNRQNFINIVSVVFELNPACKVNKDGRVIQGQAVYVDLWPAPNGEYMPYNASRDSFTDLDK